MEFLKRLFSNNDKSYSKYGDILKKPLTSKEQRDEAIHTLSKAPFEKRVPELLKRFQLVIDHGLLDNKEKEQCMTLIIEAGEIAKPFLEEALRGEKRISWIIKTAEKIYSDEDYLNLLLSNLSNDIEIFDEEVLEKNVELLLALKEIKNNVILERITPFLTHRDENVRMAALECLEEQAVSFTEGRELLKNLVANTPMNDDNSRFVGLINTILQKHKWI